LEDVGAARDVDDATDDGPDDAGVGHVSLSSETSFF
nr:hypothetical protein [Tanacetum cinerariifolium]